MTEPGQASGPGPQRIGDAERDRAAELLRDHLAEGRLSADEFDERVDAALRAKVLSDLDPIFADLPGPRPGQAVATTTSYEPPPWQQGKPNPPAPPAPSAASAPPAPYGDGPPALAIVSAIMWPATILLITFVFGWGQFWWLVFVPIIISMVMGRSGYGRERERRHIAREQERLDRRRRQIGD